MDLQAILSGIDVKADWVGLRYVKENTGFRLVRDGKPEANTRESKQGIMVEVLVNGQFAYYGTSRLDAVGIQAAADRAVVLAKAASKYSLHSFGTEARPVAKGSYRSAFQTAAEAFSPGELSELLIKASTELKVSDKVVSTNAMARIVESESHFVSSNGSDFDQQFLMVSADYSAVAQDGSITQKRTDGGLLAKSYQTGMEVFNEQDVLARCRIIGAEAVELLSAEDCPTGTMDLVLAPDQMMLQIHESVGHALRSIASWAMNATMPAGALCAWMISGNSSMAPSL